ncbi:UNVERIFIED_CONTAM: Serine/threonine-protein phosphatase 7 long form [Sesamum radiatum]|uniref:Serine/threonine-protein phosphatase 7 long form n=1 Tax=Sesamum radiatum TaxID=300843 RepID=A0AAW2MYT7_SESRA
MDRRAVYGPRDGTVLSQQSQHRSDEILDGDIDEVLQAKRADGKFWKNLREQDLPIRVQQILHQIGFYGVYRCGRIQYDCHLITALVERWRSETHSFHFRVGEATITLQDVQVKAIISHISRVQITPDTPNLTVVQFGPGHASFHFVPDLVLHVYIWAHTIYNNRVLPGAPYGAMWNCEHTFTRTVRTTVRVIRDILDEMQYDQFIWQPYDMESNVIMAYAGDFNPQLWRSICPLIFYAIVEMHHPERVLRQFGMMQNIPDQPDTRDMSLHKITRFQSWSFNSIYASRLLRAQPPQDYYVPQPSQDDWFQSTSYMPSHAKAYSSHVDLDLGLGINQPYAPGYNISPIPFPSFSAYRDNVESSFAASSSGLHINFGGDDNDGQNEPIQIWAKK